MSRMRDARCRRGHFFADFLWTSKESQSPVGESPDDLVFVILTKGRNMNHNKAPSTFEMTIKKGRDKRALLNQIVE